MSDCQKATVLAIGQKVTRQYGWQTPNAVNHH